MIPLNLLATVAFAVLFSRAAYHEHMSPAVWALSSFALSTIVSYLGGGVGMIILAQIGLFALMTWYNAFRKRP